MAEIKMAVLRFGSIMIKIKGIPRYITRFFKRQFSFLEKS